MPPKQKEDLIDLQQVKTEYFDMRQQTRWWKIVFNLIFFQRAGAQEIYGKVPRGPSLGPRPGMEEMDFSDDDAAPLTEPIYSGRYVNFLVF